MMSRDFFSVAEQPDPGAPVSILYAFKVDTVEKSALSAELTLSDPWKVSPSPLAAAQMSLSHIQKSPN